MTTATKERPNTRPASATMQEEQEINEIMSGLTGPLRIGTIYYVKTVTFHYIGRLSNVGYFLGVPYLELEQCHLTIQAGDSGDAVSKILQGKAKPKQWEDVGYACIWLHAVTEHMRFDEKVNPFK